MDGIRVSQTPGFSGVPVKIRAYASGQGLLLSAAVAAAVSLAGIASAAPSAQRANVTAARLSKAESEPRSGCPMAARIPSSASAA